MLVDKQKASIRNVFFLQFNHFCCRDVNCNYKEAVSMQIRYSFRHVQLNYPLMSGSCLRSVICPLPWKQNEVYQYFQDIPALLQAI